MPQSMNKKVRLDLRLAAPARKDSFRGNIFDLCAETRKRALRMNEGQDNRLHEKRNIIERHKREKYIKDIKEIRKIDTSVKNLFIYKQALENYKYDKLVIVKHGFPNDFRPERKRMNTETKFLHSGFSVNLLKPEIDILSEELDPRNIRMHKMHQQYVISKARSDISLSRTGTFSALIRDYKHRSVEAIDLPNHNFKAHQHKTVYTHRSVEAKDFPTVELQKSSNVLKLPKIQK